jgi:hypothetical protein
MREDRLTLTADRAEAAVKHTPSVTANSSHGTHRATLRGRPKR